MSNLEYPNDSFDILPSKTGSLDLLLSLSREFAEK